MDACKSEVTGRALLVLVGAFKARTSNKMGMGMKDYISEEDRNKAEVDDYGREPKKQKAF